MNVLNGSDARSNACSGWISFCVSGRRPTSQARSKVGAITNAVRNSASETITAFGGAVPEPSAERSSDSTTTIRVNDVTMIRIDGASDRIESSAINWITRSVTPVPPPKFSVMSCAAA